MAKKKAKNEQPEQVEIDYNKHWKTNFDYPFLGAHDLETLTSKGKDLVVSIKRLYKQEVKSDREQNDICTIAEFVQPQVKDMIINKTNFDNLSTAFSSTNPINFLNTPIAIFPKPNVWNGKKKVTALRIRDFKPTIELRPIADGEIGKAADWLNKEGNLDKYKELRAISPEREKEIKELAKIKADATQP